MAFTINHVVLVGGNLTRDAELKYLTSGTAKLSFDIAMNRSYYSKEKGELVKEEPSFFKVIYWGRPAESIAEYMKKGKKVAVEGRLSQRRWQGNDGKTNSIVEVVASNVVLMDGGGGGRRSQDGDSGERTGSTFQGGAATSPPPADQGEYQAPPFNGYSEMSDEDVPF